jgi:hypothetical protein
MPKLQALGELEWFSNCTEHLPTQQITQQLHSAINSSTMPIINNLLDLGEGEIFLQLLQQGAFHSLETRMPAGPRVGSIQNCIAGHKRLLHNCVSAQPVYNDQMFKDLLKWQL